jgi:N-methylhydantoinase B/oxoprolinase/acetone carboxylase alpha subunit
MSEMDPVTAELIRNSLQAIVDEMALTLVRTAYSANLKSAMDLSSALCDEQGRLIRRASPCPCTSAPSDAMAACCAVRGHVPRVTPTCQTSVRGAAHA